MKFSDIGFGSEMRKVISLMSEFGVSLFSSLLGRWQKSVCMYKCLTYGITYSMEITVVCGLSFTQMDSFYFKLTKMYFEHFLPQW